MSPKESESLLICIKLEIFFMYVRTNYRKHIRNLSIIRTHLFQIYVHNTYGRLLEQKFSSTPEIMSLKINNLCPYVIKEYDSESKWNI